MFNCQKIDFPIFHRIFADKKFWDGHIVGFIFCFDILLLKMHNETCLRGKNYKNVEKK